MLDEILKILKLIFIASSLTVFIVRFGGPSYTTFAERRTFMSTSKVDFDLTNPPAISVSLGKVQNFNLIEKCIEENKNDYQEAVACIDREFDIKHLLDADQDVPIENWVVMFQSWWEGKIYTLSNYTTKYNSGIDLFFIHQEDRKINIQIHDPDFFVSNERLTVPSARYFLSSWPDTLHWCNVEAVSYSRLSVRAGEECQEEEDWSFTTCVEESVAISVGCHHPWMSHTANLPPCTEVQELRKFHEVYEAMLVMDLSEVTEQTGCLPPCHYTAYSLPETCTRHNYTRDHHRHNTALSLIPGRKKITKRTEVMMYPLESLVAEFGGGLGLFLGFSFMEVWGLVERVIRFITKR